MTSVYLRDAIDIELMEPDENDETLKIGDEGSKVVGWIYQRPMVKRDKKVQGGDWSSR